MPPKLLACIGFLYKVVHKNGRLQKFNRAQENEFYLFIAWTIFMKLGTLVHHVHGYKTLPQIFNIFYGLSYGLSKSKKRGKIITKLSHRAKIKKSEATFVILPFLFHSGKTVCVNRN